MAQDHGRERDLERDMAEAIATRAPSNGNTFVAESQLEDPELTRMLIESMQSVNLDEVTNEVIRVAVRDYEETTVTHNGKSYPVQKPVTRIAEIYDYVPYDVLNDMLASRAALLKRCTQKGL